MKLVTTISGFIERKSLSWIKRTVFWKIARIVFLLPKTVYSFRYMFYRSVRNRKTIFILIHALSGGGAERVATVLANELSKNYHVVIIYMFNKENGYPILPEVDLMQVPIFSWRPKWQDTYSTFFVKLLKKRQRVYASISLLYGMNQLNVASKANDKIICSERNNPTKNGDAERFDSVQSIYERADHVVFQSTVVRDLFNDVVRSHCSILPNPVSVTCLRKEKTKHRIVNSARLVAQKNQALLIKAFAKFHSRYPEYSLSIYGEGALKQELEHLIKNLGMQGIIKLEGRSISVYQDISDAEIFVLSSDFEGLSNSLLEAMMMGFPCISTDCEGSTDVIEDGENGLLIKRGDEQGLLNAMCLLAENPEYREQLGQQAMITAERFKKEKVAEEWAQLIEQV